MESSTGVKRANSKARFAVSFDDGKCPVCGERLELDEKRLGGEDLKVRFICRNCGVVIPLYHLAQDPNIVYPLTDDSIHQFLSNLGVDIRDSRLKLKNT